MPSHARWFVLTHIHMRFPSQLYSRQLRVTCILLCRGAESHQACTYILCSYTYSYLFWYVRSAITIIFTLPVKYVDCWQLLIFVKKHPVELEYVPLRTYMLYRLRKNPCIHLVVREQAKSIGIRLSIRLSVCLSVYSFFFLLPSLSFRVETSSYRLFGTLECIKIENKLRVVE